MKDQDKQLQETNRLLARYQSQEGKRKKLMKKLSVASVIGLTGFVAMGWPFFQFMTSAGKKDEKKKVTNRKKWFMLYHTTVNHPKYEHEKEYEEGRAWCEGREMRDIYINSRDGLRLHGSYLPAEKPERFVILCHGYRGTRFGTVAHMARFLHEHNCSLLLIDQRCSGESEGKRITFGAKEQYDVLDWISRLEEENEQGLPVYLLGQSMGAATVLLAASHELPSNVRGLIADCGFNSMKQQLRDIASEWFGLHGIELLLLRVDLFCRLFGKFSMKETKVESAMANIKIPVLFFHGLRDTYVMPSNSIRNYELCKGKKELVLIPGARHACCSYTDPELYQKKLWEFFSRIEQENKA